MVWQEKNPNLGIWRDELEVQEQWVKNIIKRYQQITGIESTVTIEAEEGQEI